MARPVDPKTRRNIAEQAEHLLHLRGYHRTSMDEIARYCGMTKANLFHHFGSKEELGLAVLEAKMVEYRSRRFHPMCSDDDPVKAVERMFLDCARFYDGNGCKAGCFIGNIALEMSDLSEEFRSRVSAFFEEWIAAMAACLRRAQKAGRLGPSLKPVSAAEAILALYEGAIMQARTRRDSAVLVRTGKVARSILQAHTTRQ